VAYITKQGRYTLASEPEWRLVALLTVARRFQNHQAAASWYISNGLALPRNCVVPGNLPLALEQTDGVIPPDLVAGRSGMASERIIWAWDARYRKRAKLCGVALSCAPQRVELQRPPRIIRDDWFQWIGHIPFTRNPPEISEDLWQSLMRRAETAD
jgi:hypothetical protein